VSVGGSRQTQGVLSFRLFGIPVQVHPFFWLVAFLLGSNSPDLAMILIWVAALLICILVHELGHAALIRAFGYYPWIILYGMGGLTSYNPAYSSETARLTPLRQILISLAGPAAGFLLAGVTAGAIAAAGYADHLLYLGGYGGFFWVVVGLPNERLQDFINNLFFICIIWGMINLLPIFPLDGGQIARQIFSAASPYRGLRWSLALSLVTATAMAAIGALYWRSWYVAILFGYFAYNSYLALKSRII
jgi:stage IV sporulation protein FB